MKIEPLITWPTKSLIASLSFTGKPLLSVEEAGLSAPPFIASSCWWTITKTHATNITTCKDTTANSLLLTETTDNEHTEYGEKLSTTAGSLPQTMADTRRQTVLCSGTRHWAHDTRDWFLGSQFEHTHLSTTRYVRKTGRQRNDV